MKVMNYPSFPDKDMILVPEDWFYPWASEGGMTPNTFIKIDSDGKAITGEVDSKFSDKLKDFSVLYSPPYTNRRQVVTTQSSYMISSTKTISYAIDPITLVFSRDKNNNLSEGLDNIFIGQQSKKPPKVTITAWEVDSPSGDVNVHNETVCKECILLGMNMVKDLLYLRFSFASIKETQTKDGGNIVKEFLNSPVMPK